ncbi:hypothetical protein NMG60_11007767 [Bertholletia excelsa]
MKRERNSFVTNGIRCGFLYLRAVLLGILLVGVFYAAREKTKPFDSFAGKSAGGSTSRCNLFAGKWVYDNESQPLYSGKKCSFMDDGMACEKYGRPNLTYLHWRWQPHGCDLPRFDAAAVLGMLRGKRLVFVGDSLNRNQWVSMVCLLEKSIPPALKSVNFEFNNSLLTFKATEYNATIDFYWAPLLVESNCDDPGYHRLTERIIRVNSIEKHAQHWIDADILVFNSYLWWRWLQVKVLKEGSFGSPDRVWEEMGMVPTYEMVLKTWSDWLEVHADRTKTKVFFVSSSPTHANAEYWGKPAGLNCYNETEPIMDQGYWGRDSDPEMMRMVEAAVTRLRDRGLEAHVLNITQLSEYRKDGHSSIFRKYWDPLTKEQLDHPQSYADCTHWCLPGVPDVWNQLLYARLLGY